MKIEASAEYFICQVNCCRKSTQKVVNKYLTKKKVFFQ